MISVVIPLYNKERSIVTTIESVLTQTYKDWELIIVNDGSTDNSLNVVQEYVHEKCKVYGVKCKVISKENGGVSSARNRGIEEAKGEYVAFLDADDYWEPTYLEVMARLINDYPEAGIYGIHHGEIKGGKKYPLPCIYPNHRGVIENPWIKGSPYWTSAVVVAKRVFEYIDAFDERMSYGEDMDVWYRTMYAYPCAFEDVTLSYYRVDSENRAMDKPMPLERHIPYYIDKYKEARLKSADFRRYFDMQMVYRLYPYLFDKIYRKEARRLAKKLDYSQLKFTMHFRLVCPHLYRLFTGR